MNSKARIFKILLLILIVLLPTTVELIINGTNNFTIGVALKILVHFGVPIALFAFAYRLGVKGSIKAILTDHNKVSRKEKYKWGLSAGFAAMGIILLTFALVWPIFDLSTIVHDLKEKANITASVFLLVAAWVVFINPFMEEFFWRGFLLEEIDRLFDSKKARRIGFYATGILFALHHVVIVYDWFNAWQFILVVTFLSFAGLFLNFLKEKTGSIFAPYLTHLLADVAIIIIGLIAFGFIKF